MRLGPAPFGILLPWSGRRSEPGTPPPGASRNASTLRFNDNHRTITAQLSPENYAEVKTLLENTAKRLESDRDTRWDQRLHDALLLLLRAATGSGSNSAGRGGLVSRAPSSWWPTCRCRPSSPIPAKLSDLAGELEAGGYLHCDVVRRLSCDSTFAVGDRRRRRTNHVRRPSATMAHPGTTARSPYGGIGTAGSRAAPTRLLPTCTTSRCGARRVRRTSPTSCFCANTITTWSTRQVGPCPGTRTRNSRSSARTVASSRRDRLASGLSSRRSPRLQSQRRPVRPAVDRRRSQTPAGRAPTS